MPRDRKVGPVGRHIRWGSRCNSNSGLRAGYKNLPVSGAAGKAIGSARFFWSWVWLGLFRRRLALIVILAPAPDGEEIHEGHARFDPFEWQAARRLAAVTGRGEDDAVSGERLMPVGQHEEMLRAVEQPFLVEVAVVFVVEALFDGFDQAADDLLKTVQGRDQIDFDDGAVPGIDDDGSHGGALLFCRVIRLPDAPDSRGEPRGGLFGLRL